MWRCDLICSKPDAALVWRLDECENGLGRCKTAGIAGCQCFACRSSRLHSIVRFSSTGSAGMRCALGPVVVISSLSDAWADATTPHGRLMLMVLGGLAEFERELILARTGDGRARAKARGVRFGRPPSLNSPPTSGGPPATR